MKKILLVIFLLIQSVYADEVNRMFKALDQEIKNCKAKFTNKKAKFKWNQTDN